MAEGFTDGGKRVATSSGFWQNFRHWRRCRPFWGGLFLLISGLELFFSANLTLGDMQVHIGPQGFLSYLLPLIMILCGLLCWFTPGQRLFYGILGLLTALYSLLGLNLGGFFLGMLLGMVGGALVIAWGPPRVPAPAAAADAVPEAAEAPEEEPGEPVGEPAPADAQTQFLPGFDDQPGEPPATGGGIHRKAFVITLAPLLATAGILAVGSRTPARADETCPAGLPSRTATATTSSAAPKTLKKRVTPKKSTSSAARKTPSSSAPAPAVSTSAPAADDSESDHPVLDGIKDGISTIVDGLGRLLGVGDDPTPSASPSTSPTATPSATRGPSGSASATTPSRSGNTSPSESTSPAPSPTATGIPCLGARVLNKVAAPDDIPVVSTGGGLLETDLLTMYDSTYDGVTSLTTADGGTVKALKFSMTKSTNKPFKLTVPEAKGHTTLIKSNELTIDGNVRFYTPKFQGKLFGVIPVTFTPESPPPLTLPVLWFTDVKINLAFVRADTLHADPLDLTEPS
jgi:hypothetical protein